MPKGLYFTAVIFLSSFSFFFFLSTLTLWGHWTDLNQTCTHIPLWLLFANFGPNLPGHLPHGLGAKPRFCDRLWSKRKRTFAQKFVFSVGRNDLFVQLPFRTVASLPRVPEVSFVSWGIRRSRSCKTDSEFGGRSAVNTLYNLAWNSSVRSVRSLRFQEFPNASVRLRRKYEAGRTNSFCFDGFFVSILCLRSVLRQGTSFGVFVWGDSVGVFVLRRFVWGFGLRDSVWDVRGNSV